MVNLNFHTYLIQNILQALRSRVQRKNWAQEIEIRQGPETLLIKNQTKNKYCNLYYGLICMNRAMITEHNKYWLLFYPMIDYIITSMGWWVRTSALLCIPVQYASFPWSMNEHVILMSLKACTWRTYWSRHQQQFLPDCRCGVWSAHSDEERYF